MIGRRGGRLRVACYSPADSVLTPRTGIEILKTRTTTRLPSTHRRRLSGLCVLVLYRQAPVWGRSMMYGTLSLSMTQRYLLVPSSFLPLGGLPWIISVAGAGLRRRTPLEASSCKISDWSLMNLGGRSWWRSLKSSRGWIRSFLFTQTSLFRVRGSLLNVRQCRQEKGRTAPDPPPFALCGVG